MKNLAFVAVLTVVMGASASAAAQGRPSRLDSHLPDQHGLTLSLDVGWDSDRIEGTGVVAVTPTLGAELTLGDKLELEALWPLIYVDLSDAISDSRFLSGNPFFAAYLVDRQEDGFFRLGFGVVLPISDLDEDGGRLFGFGAGPGIETIAYGYARAIRGMWDAWLYYPDQLALVVPAQLEGRYGALVLGAEGAAGLLVPTDHRVDPDTDLVLQAAGLVALRAGPVTAGLRVQAVWSPTSDGNAQVAGVPFVQGDFNSGNFVYARFLLNLDEPLGVIGDGADIWGVFIGAGARL